MKPPIPLQTSLSAVIALAFLITSNSSGAAITKPVKHSAITNHVVDVARASKNPGNFNLVVPETLPNKPSNREKTAHNDEKNAHHIAKTKTHPDEEKHKNHLYHYDRIKRNRKKYCSLLCVLVKFFVAITYLSVLICGYLSIFH
jgi:hypothetical protein